MLALNIGVEYKCMASALKKYVILVEWNQLLNKKTIMKSKNNVPFLNKSEQMVD